MKKILLKIILITLIFLNFQANTEAINVNIDAEPITSTWVSDHDGKTAHTYKMVQFNNQLFQAHTGINGRIYTRSTSNSNIYQNEHKHNWNRWNTGNQTGEKTIHPIAMTAVRNRIYQSHTGMDGKIYTRSSIDGSQWTNWVKGSQRGEFTNIGVDLTSFNNQIYQVHTGRDGRIYTRFSNDGVVWSNWATGEQAGEFTSHPVVMTVFNNQIYQTHVGRDGKIYTRSSPNGINWTSWARGQQTDEKTKYAIAVTATDDLIYQSHTGMDKKIYSRFSADGINWSNWAEDVGITNISPVLATFHGKVFQGAIREITGGIIWRTIDVPRHTDLQTAIDNAESNETIYLPRGTTTENINIPIEKTNISIVGRSIEESILQGNITIVAPNTTLKDLTVKGNVTITVSTTIENTIIEGNLIAENGTGDGTTITNSKILKELKISGSHINIQDSEIYEKTYLGGTNIQLDNTIAHGEMYGKGLHNLTLKQDADNHLAPSSNYTQDAYIAFEIPKTENDYDAKMLESRKITIDIEGAKLNQTEGIDWNINIAEILNLEIKSNSKIELTVKTGKTLNAEQEVIITADNGILSTDHSAETTPAFNISAKRDGIGITEPEFYIKTKYILIRP